MDSSSTSRHGTSALSNSAMNLPNGWRPARSEIRSTHEAFLLEMTASPGKPNKGMRKNPSDFRRGPLTHPTPEALHKAYIYMCVYMYVYIYTCIHIHIYIYIYIYIYYVIIYVYSIYVCTYVGLHRYSL